MSNEGSAIKLSAGVEGSGVGGALPVGVCGSASIFTLLMALLGGIFGFIRSDAKLDSWTNLPIFMSLKICSWVTFYLGEWLFFVRIDVKMYQLEFLKNLSNTCLNKKWAKWHNWNWIKTYFWHFFLEIIELFLLAYSCSVFQSFSFLFHLFEFFLVFSLRRHFVIL